jgi:hypothetical protein
MQNSQLNRVLSLVRRTGDRMIIMDNESDSVMVLMGLDAYEKMLGTGPDSLVDLSEEQMLEKINRDIAKWRSYNDKCEEEGEVDFSAVNEPEMHAPENQPTEKKSADENLEPLDLTGGETDGLEVLPVSPEEEDLGQDMAKIDQEEPLSGIQEEEEEKFYLEPVE